MTQLSPSHINTLRSRPHSTRLYLSIYQPKTIFSAQVTGTYNQGDNRISFYGIATGSWWQIYPNMTARLGSTVGGNEYGDLRVRSASGTYIDFAENEIIWQQGMYLTLIDAVDVVAVYPRIIQDPNNQTNVIFYKDLNIPYTNQNTVYGTFPCAGPHRAGFVVTGAYSTYWSSSGTYNVNGDSLTFSWAFEGGTPTGSTARDPGWVQYTQPGQYKTRLIVTSSAGAVDTTYRYVSVYQRPNQGTNNPIEAWELEELSGSRGEGGYTARIKMMSILPDLQPHALVVIWAEDSYGGNLVSLGGNSENNESIVFVGYVLSDSIKFNYKQSTMEFSIGSVSELMKEAEGFSVSVESKAAATTWYELTEMTIQKALYHYLRWHSTVLNVFDFQYTNDDRYLQYFDSDRTSLFDAVDNFLRNGLLGALVADRQSKLWAEISHFGLEAPFTGIRSNMSLNKQDWMEEPTITERRDSDTSFVELGGIAYYGTATNTFSALISDAPGLTPLYHGKAERQEGMVLLSQAQLNQVAANYLAYKNTPFPEVVLPLNGNYRNIDIAPQEQFYLVIVPLDTIRNVSLQSYPYIPTSMSWRYESTKQLFIPELVVEQMATGTMAETVLIPATSPPFQDSGFDYPSLQLPPFPVFNPSDAVGPSAPTVVVIHDTTNGLLYAANFDAVSPNWQFFNAGLSAAQKASVNFFFRTPNGACYCGYASVASTSSSGNMFLARAPYLGGTWTILYDINNLRTGAGSWGVGGAAYNPLVPETVGVVLWFSVDSTPTFYVGANLSFVQGAAVSVATYNFNWTTSFGGDGSNLKWMVTSYGAQAQGKVKLLSIDGSTINPASGPVSGNLNPTHVRAGITGITFHDRVGQGLFIAEGNYSTVTENTDTKIKVQTDIQNPFFAIDDTGYYGMTRWDVGERGRTTDKGFTWGAIANLPFSSSYYFAFAGGAGTSSRWVAAGGTVIRYSPDFGNSWLNKEGNITSLVPISVINMVKVLGV